jgi:putative oxidoreductase
MKTDFLSWLGRAGLAAIFLWSGLGKLASAEGTIAYIAAADVPVPALAFAVAVAVELTGAAALLFGVWARVAAAGLALFCLATAVLFHSEIVDEEQMIHFLKNAAIAGGLLQVTAFGPGRWTLRSLWRAMPPPRPIFA